jgi:hypothetical protein
MPKEKKKIEDEEQRLNHDQRNWDPTHVYESINDQPLFQSKNSNMIMKPSIENYSVRNFRYLWQMLPKFPTVYQLSNVSTIQLYRLMPRPLNYPLKRRLHHRNSPPRRLQCCKTAKSEPKLQISSNTLMCTIPGPSIRARVQIP